MNSLEGSGLGLDEAIAYDRQNGGAVPPFIEAMASRLADAFHWHGGVYADAVFAHWVTTLRISQVDQAWILKRWGRSMMRQH
jgi:hypothetical protein